MGVGMTAVVSQSSTDEALGMLASRGVTAWVLGETVPGDGEARLTGSHPAAG